MFLCTHAPGLDVLSIFIMSYPKLMEWIQSFHLPVPAKLHTSIHQTTTHNLGKL